MNKMKLAERKHAYRERVNEPIRRQTRAIKFAGQMIDTGAPKKKVLTNIKQNYKMKIKQARLVYKMAKAG